jgi:hypothetical protein
MNKEDLEASPQSSPGKHGSDMTLSKSRGLGLD